MIRRERTTENRILPSKRMQRIAAVVLLLGLAPAYAQEATPADADHLGPAPHGR